MNFDPSQFGPACAALINAAPPTELGPGEPNRDAYEQLRSLDLAAIFGDRPILDTDMADGCRAGLWLLHGFLDESHRISQNIGSTTGSYWHGIMHRREPDFSNAKYWFRRVGAHPVFEPLAVAADRAATAPETACSDWTGGEAWDPLQFVDLCEATLRGRRNSTEFCLAVAQAEWKLLFAYCYRSACES